jgi:hypothetical protein
MMIPVASIEISGFADREWFVLSIGFGRFDRDRGSDG